MIVANDVIGFLSLLSWGNVGSNGRDLFDSVQSLLSIYIKLDRYDTLKSLSAISSELAEWTNLKFCYVKALISS